MSLPEKSADAARGQRVLSPGRRRVFLCTILLSLAIAQEVICRWLFPMPECTSFNRMNYTPIEFYGDDLWEAQQRGLSNVKLHMESEPDGFAFDHTLNLYGFRGPNFSLEPPADRSRIVFIGDSFAEGAGASDDATIAEQFRRLIAANRPADVVNLGITGTGLAHYSRIARDSLPLLKPRALFVVICFNDIPTTPISEFEDLSEPPRTFDRLNPYVPRAVTAITRWRAGQSVPSRFLSGPYHIHAAVPSRANPLSNIDPPANIDPEILDAMKRGKTNPWNVVMAAVHERALRWDYAKSGGAGEYLRLLKSLCDQQSCRLIVVFIPHPVTTNSAYMSAQVRMGADYGKITRLDGPVYRAQQRHLQEMTRTLEIPFLDATEELVEAEKSGVSMYWPVDGHCTAAGYRVVSEICARHWLDGTMPRDANAPPEIDPQR